MTLARISHPVLSCDEARAFEAQRFAGDEAKEWAAMLQAGHALGAAVLRDFEEIGGFPVQGRVLVLVGKGHNGGDALIATRFILEYFPQATADVVFAFGERKLRPLAAHAWRDLVHVASSRVRGSAAALAGYDLCLDGIFGFQFRPPMGEPISALIERVNKAPIRLRAAVDLPSGLAEKACRMARFSARILPMRPAV
jgi:NAD(P)H-hydrate epimerase